ncbi:hypothetical protein B0H12DRAFT_1235016 [Mycena haematopus]|nr:hypothetical protein B0H12DRAFT_1235016 [Mycena haematopus]
MSAVDVVPTTAPTLPSISPEVINVPPAQPGLYVYRYDAKRRNHADAQARYRERNLAQTRARARVRMQRLRAARDVEARREAAEHRKKVDAEYREIRRQQKFMKTFGEQAFFTHYLPLVDKYGKDRVAFMWGEEAGKVKRRKPRTA